MLTPYRTQDAHEMSGIGDSALNWYSRRLARELTQAGVHVTIVGPRLGKARSAVWNDDGIDVHSCFVRRSTWATWQAHARIASLRNPVVHVQHELFAFGGLSSALMLPMMLTSLRRRGFKVITTIHGVIPLADVSNEFVQANRIPGNATIVRALWRTLIRRVALTSDVVHVHEAFLRDLLAHEYGLSKVSMRVIPLGIEPAIGKPDRALARRWLQIPKQAEVALFFGYLSPYKGIEYLLAELPQMLAARPQLHLVIAGSVPSRLAGSIDPATVVRNLSVGMDRVHLCGFVPDPDTSKIFAAADVLVLPYRVAMSASGPLALALGFDVPVLMSQAFERPFPQAPFFFELKQGALTHALARFFDEPGVFSLFSDFVNAIRLRRSWHIVAHSLSAVYEDISRSQ